MMSLRGIESLGANQMRTLLAFTLQNPELVPKKKPTRSEERRAQLRQQVELMHALDNDHVMDLGLDLAALANEVAPMAPINDLHLPDGF